MEEKVFVCPASDYVCPYYKGGNCSMYPEYDPREECDEAWVYSEEFDDCDYEVGFDPYLGCYTDDC